MRRSDQYLCSDPIESNTATTTRPNQSTPSWKSDLLHRQRGGRRNDAGVRICPQIRSASPLFHGFDRGPSNTGGVQLHSCNVLRRIFGFYQQQLPAHVTIWGPHTNKAANKTQQQTEYGKPSLKIVTNVWQEKYNMVHKEHTNSEAGQKD